MENNLVHDVVLWKARVEMESPLPNQKLAVSASREDIAVVQRYMGMPESDIQPGFVGMISGVEIYCEQDL